MRKFLPYILILIVLVGVFGPINKVGAQPAPSAPMGTCIVALTETDEQKTQTTKTDCDALGGNWLPNTGGGTSAAATTVGGGVVDPNQENDCTLFGNWDKCILDGLTRISFILMGIMALLLWMAGTLLDFVLNFTIVNMRDHIKDLTGINIAWKLIRDLMNIAFIFLLVYEGIKIIINQSDLGKVKKWISMVILASLLINFSLFFTKVLIDASNIVTIGFYNSMIDASVEGNAENTSVAKKSGLSVAFMSMLGASDFYSRDTFGDLSQMQQAAGGDSNLLMIGLLGSLVFLIISFVFLAVTCLFVIRYITLVILLMLSPIAYMGMALPFMKKYSSEWWSSLNGQLLFAPIYMIMTSIVLVLMSSPGFITKTGNWSNLITNGGGAGAAAIGSNTSVDILFNFIVVIGLLIASLVIAKSTSKQGSNFIGQASGKLTAFAGGAVMGTTAWASRKSLGYVGNKVAGNAALQEDAIKKTGFGGAWARTKLYTARTARDASFDVRNASIPTSVAGDLIEGTLGRTGAGKRLGLNNVNIPSVAVGAPMANLAGLGKGGEKGYKEEKAASDKVVRERETANTNELELAKAKQAVIDGAKDTATAKQIEDMEKALSKLSDKQTEALVAGNRDLLEKLNFANSISVKQLEAINKSDQFSDDEKDKLKKARFSQINAAMAPGGAGASSVSGKIKTLSDSELEMINVEYLNNSAFLEEMRPAQVESIIKSNKFTTSQKDRLKDERKAPLLDALDTSRTTHAPSPAVVKKFITKTLSPKDLAGLMGTNATFTDHTGAVVTGSILTHPEVLNQFTPNLLKRIAPELNSVDVQTLHDAIEDAGTAPGASAKLTALAAWLISPDGQSTFS